MGWCVQSFTMYGQLKNTRLLRQCSSFVEHMCWHKTSRLQHCTLQEYSDITDRSNRIYGSTHIFSWLLPVQNSARSSPHISLHGHDFDKIIIKQKKAEMDSYMLALQGHDFDKIIIKQKKQRWTVTCQRYMGVEVRID